MCEICTGYQIGDIYVTCNIAGEDLAQQTESKGDYNEDPDCNDTER